MSNLIRLIIFLCFQFAIVNYQAQSISKKLIEEKIIKGEEDGIERISYWDTLYDLAIKNNFQEEIAKILNNTGIIYCSEGKQRLAEKCYNESIKIYSKLNNKKGISNVYSSFALLYDEIGNIKYAMDYYYKSLALAEETNNKELQMELYNNIALIFQNQEDFKMAETYLRKAYFLSTQMKDEQKIAYSLNNLGTLFYYMQKIDSATVLFEKSREIREQINDLPNLAESLNNLGAIYREKNEMMIAKKYLEKALTIHEKLGSNEGQCYTKINLSRLFLKQNKLKLALNIAKSSLENSFKTNNPNYISEAADAIYITSIKNSNYKLALEMKELYVKMNDSINNNDNKKTLIKSQLKYEYEKKAAADSVKVAEERKISQLKLKQEKTQKQYLYLGLFAITLFGIFMFNRFRVTKKQKAIIEQQKVVVEQQKALVDEKQKEILDSIRYAKRIQQALMPSKKCISEAINIKNTLIVFCCFLTLSYFGQDKKIDSLKKELIYASNDTSKCLVLESLISLENDEDLIVKYNNELMRIAQNNLKKQTKDKNIFTQFLAEAYNNKGVINNNKGNIPLAIKCYEECLKLGEFLNDSIGMAQSLNNLGVVYNSQQNFEKALEYHHKSLAIRETIDEKEGIAISLSNIGSIYKDLGKLDEALKYFEKSLEIKKVLGKKKLIAKSLNKIATIYLLKKDNKKALKYYQNSLEICEELEYAEGLSIVLTGISNLYFNEKQLKLSEKYGLQAMAISKELGYPKNIKESALLLFKIYKEIGNSKLALNNYELYISMRDSINNSETRKASIKSQLKYEYEKKAAADSVKVAEERKISQLKLKQEKTQKQHLYIGLFAITLFGIFMFNRFRVTKKQKNIIEQQKIIVEQQKALVDEKQKEILDSIRYAKRIQLSLLPTEKYINRVFKENYL